MKIKILNTIFAFLLCSVVFSQSKAKANKYYNKLAYIKSAKLYKGLYDKGDKSKIVIERLAYSYYKNSQTKDAEYWYKELLDKFSDVVSDDDFFNYAQSLSSNGNYKKSDSIFAVLKAKGYKFGNNKLKPQSNGENICLNNLSINTKYSDFGAFVYKDELFFTSSAPFGLANEDRMYRWNNQPYLNMYKAKLVTKEGGLCASKDSISLSTEEKSLFNKKLTTRYHESNPIFTRDGKKVYFTRVNCIDGDNYVLDKEGKVNLKLYSAEFVNDKWRNLKELPFNSDEYSVGHPALSQDGKTLYFSSNMPGTIGGTDIFKVAIKDSGYGKPVNLGDKINTKKREAFPYIGVDNTLYFSSDGHKGIGLLDIFKSTLDSDGDYVEPTNMQEPFNSSKDDFSFYIDETRGFLSSNREGGKGDDDIYSFNSTVLAIEKACEQKISGIVIDKVTKLPIKNAVIEVFDKKNKSIRKIISDNLGKFDLGKFPCNIGYSITGSKLNYDPVTKPVKFTESVGVAISFEMDLSPLIVGDKIIINPIYFDFNKSNIRNEAAKELDRVVKVLNDNPKIIIKIESHTDSRGDKEYNRSLSDRRAKSTRKYIMYKGIPGDRIISAIGYGEDNLLNHCNDAKSKQCTEKQHQLNRRSYFIIVGGAPNVQVENTKLKVIDSKK